MFILWFGWFGFNPGSTMAATTDIAHIAVTTNLAAAAGAIAAMVTAWFVFKKPDLSMSAERRPGRPGGHHLPLRVRVCRQPPS